MSYLNLKEMKIFPLNLLSTGAYKPPEITNLFVINQVKLQRKRNLHFICLHQKKGGLLAFVPYAFFIRGRNILLKNLGVNMPPPPCFESSGAPLCHKDPNAYVYTVHPYY